MHAAWRENQTSDADHNTPSMILYRQLPGISQGFFYLLTTLVVKNRYSLAGLVYLAVLVVIAGPVCAQDISLPEMGSSADRVISPEEERRLGFGAVLQLRAQGIMLEDPLTTAYVQELGERLLGGQANRLDFNFFVVNDNSINAFALPGGFVGINTGLILASNDESELAGVMAHEIIHVLQRHIARRLEGTKGLDIATAGAMLAAILVSGGNPAITQAALSTGIALSVENAIRFTYTNEQEADRLGLRLLADANFDPTGMPRFFSELQQTNRYNESAYGDFIRTHPVTSGRIAESQERARSYPLIGTEQNSRAYYLIHQRLHVLGATDLDPLRIALNTEMISAQPIKAESARYAYGLVLLRQNNFAEAEALFSKLIEQRPTEPAYRLSLGDTLLARGNKDKALATYQMALQLFPANYTLSLACASTLLATNQAKEAQTVLKKLPAKKYLTPEHPRLLGRIAEAQGNRSQTHAYLAEQYVMQGQLFLALEQIKLALKAPDVSNMDNVALNARWKEIRRLYRESNRQ